MPKTHANYDKDFRQEAVNLLLSSGRRSSGWPQSWEYQQTHYEHGATGLSATGEIRRLQRENEYLRRQREILKKAMSILSEDPQSSMR